MNVPAEIANYAPAIVDFCRDALVKGLETQLGTFAWRQIRRALARNVPVLKDADPRELLIRMERMEATLRGFSSQLRSLKGESGGVLPADDEMLEPATQDFIADAFAAAMESPSEQKREVLGCLIAERLYSATESREELYLRQAFAITRRANQRHLEVLAMLLLVHTPPLPVRKMTRAQLNRWFDDKLLKVVDQVSKTKIRFDDLHYLVSIGAVEFSEQEQYSTIGGMSSHAASIEQVMVRATREHYLPEQTMTDGRFYQAVRDLFYGRPSKDEGDEDPALAPYTLTASGRTVARLVLKCMANGDIFKR